MWNLKVKKVKGDKLNFLDVKRDRAQGCSSILGCIGVKLRGKRGRKWSRPLAREKPHGSKKPSFLQAGNVSHSYKRNPKPKK